MEKQYLSILGSVHQLEDKTTSCTVRDPFSATMYDFIRCCLLETTKALHATISYTYKQLSESKQKSFYLIGYKSRRGWQTKIYGDPSNVEEGHDIKWMLKNLRWHWEKYSAYMELYEDAFDDITGFLLSDLVQEEYADSGSNGASVQSENFDLLDDCFEACLELVTAISESKFYQPICFEVAPFQHNIESMLPIVSQFKVFRTKQEGVQTENSLATDKVISFLGGQLLKELNKESKVKSANPADKPVTNFFLYTVMPRFENANGDSGIDELFDNSRETDNSLVIIDHFQSTPQNKALERIKKHGKGFSPRISSGKGKGYSPQNSSRNGDQMDGSFLVL